MKHPERKLARRYDFSYHAREYYDVAYGGESENSQELWDKMKEIKCKPLPNSSEYQVFFGDLHGHTCLSDGTGNIDGYFKELRDHAKLDFAALSDHDHGGVGNKPLWDGGKWDLIRQKVKEYNCPGKFTTILAYEKDSYPWYPDLVVYYDNYEGEMLRGKRDGEITREELREYLKREDLLLIPHDTQIRTDFLSMEVEDMTPLIQIYSRGSCAERFNDHLNIFADSEGGHWQDALKKGARMGCIAASDDHDNNGGLILEKRAYPILYPGITGVWAKENTLPAIFEALKARRCYGFTGGRIILDFRINGHYMGEEFSSDEDREICYRIEADAPIDSVTLVKNCRDYLVFRRDAEQVIYDYKQENDVDYYYLRVKLADGRMAWSSPIWINRKR